jgi:hypothetical protein
MKDGLCWLLNPASYPGFMIWDTSAPPQALELSYATSKGRKVLPKIVGFKDCSMVPDLIPLNLSIETFGITASYITGISFRFYSSREWEKFEVFLHAESHKPTYQTKFSYLVFMPLPANDEILWLQLRSSRHASSLMVFFDMSYQSLLTGPSLAIELSLIMLKVETKLSGVIHIGCQAAATFRVKAFSRRPQLMLCNDGVCEDNLHQPLAFYPKGDPKAPQALKMITGPQLRHNPPNAQLFWSWAVISIFR